MRQAIDSKAFGRRVKEKRRELGMSQEALGKTSGYSQTNVQWAESGKAKDPIKLAQYFAEPLRTTAEWLLYETGTRDIAPPPMTAAEIGDIYDKLPLAEREAFSAQFSEAIISLNKKRKTRAAG